MSLKGLPLFDQLGTTGEPPEEKPSEKPGASKKSAARARTAEQQDQNAAPEEVASPREPAPEPQRPLSVTELTARIRGTLEPAFNDVWVRGEISNFRPAASGHVYFSLKDEGANVSAAVFGWGRRGARNGFGNGGPSTAARGSARASFGQFELKDGMEVLCRGKISVYPPRGSYQLIVEHIEPLGAGALQVAFEQLKAKLAGEGLFDRERKRPLPAFPTSVAVVTSPSGAAIRDMLNVLGRRAPNIRVTVIPAIVQGADAPAQIIRGLELANRHRLGDVVVLARGGGSIEDLWCFNDEELARAISRSELPVVSAVGHEIDFTISDFVADLRAPTPSAAAEIVSANWVDVLRRIHDGQERLLAAMRRGLQNRKVLLQHVCARLVSPKDRLREQAQRCDELAMRMENSMRNVLERRHAVLGQCTGKLDALSPLRVLERGYSIVFEAADGAESGAGKRVVRRAADLSAGQKIRIRFHDGERDAEAL